MKYKLIKEYPGSPKLGAIVVKGTNIKCRGLYMGMDNNKYYPVNDMTNEYGIAENKIENYPEFWAKYAFTSPCGVDMFVGDDCWVAGEKMSPIRLSDRLQCWMPRHDTQGFPTEAAAMAWYNAQQQPNFQMGDWVYYKYPSLSKEYLFRFKKDISSSFGYAQHNGEVYVFEKGEYLADYNCGNRIAEPSLLKKPSPKKIEELLVKVAKTKGFVEGAKFAPPDTKRLHVTKKGTPYYVELSDSLWNGNGFGIIYKKGQWATLNEEKEVKELTWDEVKKAIDTNPVIKQMILDERTNKQ